ncbi:hypothetical protein D3C87_2173740 [compost metagenome]
MMFPSSLRSKATGLFPVSIRQQAKIGRGLKAIRWSRGLQTTFRMMPWLRTMKLQLTKQSLSMAAIAELPITLT